MKRSVNRTDEKMRSMMGTLLRTGVLSAAFIVLTGGVLFFVQHPDAVFNYSRFMGEPERLRDVHTIIKDALQWRSRAIIQSGLLVLMATPVARVFFSWIGFIIEKDWIYVIITMAVLIILLISLFSNALI